MTLIYQDNARTLVSCREPIFRLFRRGLRWSFVLYSEALHRHEMKVLSRFISMQRPRLASWEAIWVRHLSVSGMVIWWPRSGNVGSIVERLLRQHGTFHEHSIDGLFCVANQTVLLSVTTRCLLTMQLRDEAHDRVISLRGRTTRVEVHNGLNSIDVPHTSSLSLTSG